MKPLLTVNIRTSRFEVKTQGMYGICDILNPFSEKTCEIWKN
jgi:hypothetical protein